MDKKKAPLWLFQPLRPSGTSPIMEECNFANNSSDRRRNEEEVALNKEKINFIEYNRGYIEYAKENRKKPTKAEYIFWGMVKNRKFLGYKFRRQKVIGSFVLDFYCSKLLLGIELDGGYHNTRIDYDISRDAEIYKKGILIIRFINENIEQNLSYIKIELQQIIENRIKNLATTS